VRLMLERINDRIESVYDRDHSIGHAYFTGLWKEQDGAYRFNALAAIFRNRVLPLLEEYFFKDWQKIRLVLADDQKDIPMQFVCETADPKQDLPALFGSDHGLENYAIRRRYSLQPWALTQSLAYNGMCKPLS